MIIIQKIHRDNSQDYTNLNKNKYQIEQSDVYQQKFDISDSKNSNSLRKLSEINLNDFTHQQIVFNPYTIADSINDDQVTLTGRLQIDQQYITANYDKLDIKSKEIIGDESGSKMTKTLNFSIQQLGYQVASLHLTDSVNERFRIPQQIQTTPSTDVTMRLEMLGFQYSLYPFSFSFRDTMTPDSFYFSTQQSSMIMTDSYTRFDFQLPTQVLFGLGERTREFKLSQGEWELGSRSNFKEGNNQSDSSSKENLNDEGKGHIGESGVQPFILVQSSKFKDDFFGIYLRCSAPQKHKIKFNLDGTTTFSFSSEASVDVEFFFFMHGSPKQVISLYHILIGKPALPPFWALGWQQTFKRNQDEQLSNVIEGFKNAEIPLDVLYVYQNITFNNPNIAQLLFNLREDLGIKIVVILNQEFIEKFIEQNILNQSDWLNFTQQNNWNALLQQIFSNIKFDGIQLDFSSQTTYHQNKITNLRSNFKDFDSVGPMSNNNFINNYNDQQFLQENSLDSESSMNINLERRFQLSKNQNQQPEDENSEKSLQSLKGLILSKMTKEYFDKHTLTRPFIMSRQTFASSGSISAHALEHNHRDWNYLRYSIAGIMNMNLFGITHSGADVCGFYGEQKDDELCLRWIQLATFYPLARVNHNSDSETEPYLIKSESLRKDAILSIQDRYKYIRLLYTCLFEANKEGGTCFDPLFYHYPYDNQTYDDYESSFMFANNLKVSPILCPLEAGENTYFSYFPKGKWVNLADFNEIIDTQKEGAFINLTVKSTINVHLKAGGLIPYQDIYANPKDKIKTTQDLLKLPISLIANRDQSGHAEGTLYLDYDNLRFQVETRTYEYYSIKVQANSVQFKLKQEFQLLKGIQPFIFDKLIIVNAKDLENVNFACAMDANMNKLFSVRVNYIVNIQALELINDQDRDVKFSEINNIYYGSTSIGDINLCDEKTFQYRIKNKIPDLSKSSVNITVENLAGTIPDLLFSIYFIDKDIINVKWTYSSQPQNKRIPVEVPNFLVNTTLKDNQTQKLSDFILISSEPFEISFYSKKNDSNTSAKPYFQIKEMILDSYLNWINVQVTVPLGKKGFKGIYGLGQRAYKKFFYEDGVYTLWAKDLSTIDEDGRAPSKDTYGVHPFFMYRHAEGSHVGVFYKLAHAQDWFIKNDKNNRVINIKTIATGGLGDIIVMTEQKSPQDIIERYYSLIGDPVLIPQWALGWHQCKWGYKNLQALNDSIKGYKDNGIPLDTQWSDIDYMDNYRDFTLNQKFFAKLPEFIDYLHSQNMKFIPIIDFGISLRPDQNYSAYDDGAEDDVFIKINGSQTGLQTLIGKVWPNEAAYPDFYNPKAVSWWHDQLSKMNKLIKFDGIWEDMNELSDFCNGICYQRQQPEIQAKNLLPYSPAGEELDLKTASIDGLHSNGLMQLDTHSYTGTLEVKATHEWFRDVKKQRTFTIERSSFAGMGKYGSTWLGDNWGTVHDMGYSVTGVMLMNMFGVQVTGADICGFSGDSASPELCARWHTVGAFYPFSRNHVSYEKKNQQPWRYQGYYEEGVAYMDIMRDAILTKYSMIRYFYTQLFLASHGTAQKYRKAFYKPLFFEFPEDLNAYDGLMHNIMLGDALKLSINSDTTEQNLTSYYFPAGIWCDLHHPNLKCLNSNGSYYDLPSKAYDYGLHLRQGHLIPHQNAKSLKAMTTYDLQQHPIDFHIHLQQSENDKQIWQATGVYINDDGISLDIEGSWNRYNIQVVREIDEDKEEQITIHFDQKVRAYKYSNQFKNTRNSSHQSQIISTTFDCSAVNQNDYLNQIYLYNAGAFKSANVYEVVGVSKDPEELEEQKIGQAKYNPETDRIIFQKIDGFDICISAFERIVFVIDYQTNIQ